MKYHSPFRIIPFLGLLVITQWQLTCDAQLTNQLKSEPIERLARDAVNNGDPTRGAILFPQEKLSCAKCHVAYGEERVGPDLREMKPDVTIASIVESILDPSKNITKGYETSRVLTTDGEVIVGRLLNESDNRIVIRESTGPQQKREIQRDQIERRSNVSLSLMPEKLADHLRSRQDFLDLVSYVASLRGQSKKTPESARESKSQLDERLRSHVLVSQYQCTKCHASDRLESLPSRHAAPRLARLVPHLSPKYIEEFISDPSHIKPSVRMPAMLAELSDNKRAQVAKQITHFLISSAGTEYTPPERNSESAERGRELYHTIGCVACHSPRDEDGAETLAATSVSLGPLQYSLNGLVEFLHDPVSFRPSGHMPSMKLSHWEAVDLANYLLSDEESVSYQKFQFDPDLADSGSEQFVRQNCHSCHGAFLKGLPIASSVNKPFQQLDPDGGCLSQETGEHPKYSFSKQDRDDLTAFVEAQSAGIDLTASERLDYTMATFRCFNCHRRGSIGGVPEERDDYFQTINPNLGPQGRIPPTLDGVGAKLRSKWLREVLVSGREIRPYVRTRMPQYGTANVEHFLDLFPTLDSLDEVKMTEPEGREPQKQLREAGLQLVGRNGMNCIACHTFQTKPGMTMSAVDLTEMRERLTPEWFYPFLLNPKRFHVGTVMPSFWPSGRSVRPEILDGDPHEQISAIWEWMRDGRQARTPQGLVIKPIELISDNEAVMLRRKYPGIGKRGIGVGYVSKVNLAFDAERLRLGLLWAGEFADPAGVWRSQGHGTVRPLARRVLQFGQVPELDYRDAPWDSSEERPPDRKFLGYELDQMRRPTFRYQFEEVTVTDGFSDIPATEGSGARLIRKLVLQSERQREDLAFRISPPENSHLVEANELQLDQQIIIRLSHPELQMERPGNEGPVTIPITLVANQPFELVLEYEWIQGE